MKRTLVKVSDAEPITDVFQSYLLLLSQLPGGEMTVHVNPAMSWKILFIVVYLCV